MSPQVGEALSEEGSGRVDEAPAEIQTTDGDHEATDVVEASSEPEPAPDVEDDKPAENGVADEKVATEPQHELEPVADGAPKDEEASVKQPTPTTSPPTSPARKITAKSSVSVKVPASKAAGGATTPLVKKVRDTSTSHNIAPPHPPRNAQNTRGAHTRLLSLTSVRVLARTGLDHRLGQVWLRHGQVHACHLQDVCCCPALQTRIVCHLYSEEGL